jgi:predicted ATP-binding protein involved in virulence
MRLDHIHIKNYRCFGELPVDLHPQLTVFVAPNGQGKTTVLDAIKVALWPFVAGFDLGSTTNDTTGIHIEDVRREQVQTHEMDWRLPCDVRGNGFIWVEQLIREGKLGRCPENWPNPEAVRPWEVRRSREKVKKGTKTKDLFVTGTFNHRQSGKFTISETYETSLNWYAKQLQQRIFSDQQTQPDELPMLGYYGTGRLWAQKKLTSAHEVSSPESQSRTFAYRDCLDPASSYKHFSSWFKRVFLSLRQAQIQNLERGSAVGGQLAPGLINPVRAVQQAINHVLPSHTGWHTVEYNIEYDELVLNHEGHGKLKVSQLSDGIRNMLALVGDIAYRCYKLNAHLGEAAPQCTRGIVMIDEVDMHLHPSWQQTVLTDLMKAFPKLQFIVTTHSPQVLTSVDAKCIRKLVAKTDPDTGESRIQVEPVTQQTRGVASADVLAAIMGVDPIPDVVEARQLAEYQALIQQNLHVSEAAQALLQGLDAHFGPDHPVMRECERLIRLQAFKQRLPVQRTSTTQG